MEKYTNDSPSPNEVSKEASSDQPPPHNLLIVDDNEPVRKLLCEQFSPHFTIYTADSAEAAFKSLDKFSIQVVLSDQHMPGISGTDFFKKIKDEHPEVVRLLLSGYADQQSAIKAINEGAVFRYVTKPWEFEDLKSIFDESFEQYTTAKKTRTLLENLQDED